MTNPLVIGLNEEHARLIAAAIDGELLVQPNIGTASIDWQWADALEAWRTLANDGPKADHIVVALFPEVRDATTLDRIDLDGWVEAIRSGPSSTEMREQSRAWAQRNSWTLRFDEWSRWAIGSP